MHKIAFPLRYLLLTMGGRRIIAFIPMVVLTASLSLPYLVLGEANYFHNSGFLDKMLTFTSCLTGFYVAGLVAAATYTHPDLDKVIRHGSIYLVDKGERGERIEEHLSRRQFVCILFGYLSFSSFALSVLSAYVVGLSTSGWPYWISKISIALDASWLLQALRSLSVVGCSAGYAHLAITTCIGLYYMMDRLHRHEPKVGGLRGDQAA